MDDDYVLKYSAEFTPEGLKFHPKNLWPEGYNHYVLTGDPSELSEYKVLEENSDFWEDLDKILSQFHINLEYHKLFKEALLKAMTRMLFSNNNMRFLSGGTERKLTTLKNKLQGIKVTPFFKSHLTNAIYTHLRKTNSKDAILNFNQAENIADFFENILPLATQSSNDALAFIAGNQNAENRNNVLSRDIKFLFAKNLALAYQKHLNKKPASSDDGLYMLIYEKACKICDFKKPNRKIAKLAISEFNDRM